VVVVNGAAADIVSTLYTDSSKIQELDYTITVPTGSLLGGLRLTAGLGFPEKVTYVFSSTQPHGVISVAASVVSVPSTAVFPVRVDVTTLLGSGSASGTSAHTLTVQVHPLLML
jgi:hypothetical protein